MLLLLLILFNLHTSSHAEEKFINKEEKPHEKLCTVEFAACAQLKSIDVNKLKWAKKNKNPSIEDKENLLTLTRCLFKEEVPTSEICKTGLKETQSSMTWFQRRVFNNFVL